MSCMATKAAYSGGTGVHGVSGCRGCCSDPGSEKRHAISCRTPSSPTTSVSSPPSTEPGPRSSWSASTHGPRRGISKSQRFSSSTRSAKREVRSYLPAATSLSAASRSESQKSRSAAVVSLERAPSMRTTPFFSSSCASTDRDGAFDGAFAFFAPFFAFVLPPPKPPAEELTARFCLSATRGVPGCNNDRSTVPRCATALSASSRRDTCMSGPSERAAERVRQSWGWTARACADATCSKISHPMAGRVPR
mmetsp:Transcript_38585/g.66225  ORF Transcript_38585/g.66225 Transcript_38585/m.66225 type:complete len:250 (+) Transcript_38585:500-1249(+)